MQGTISLPKFRMEYKAELKDALSALGMRPAFEPSVDGFAAMTTAHRVFISKVTHKTFVEVNEQGTEASAATSVGMVATAIQASGFDMVVDHPFLCAIRDNQTGAVLFVGAVTDPGSNQ